MENNNNSGWKSGTRFQGKSLLSTHALLHCLHSLAVLAHTPMSICHHTMLSWNDAGKAKEKKRKEGLYTLRSLLSLWCHNPLIWLSGWCCSCPFTQGCIGWWQMVWSNVLWSFVCCVMWDLCQDIRFLRTHLSWPVGSEDVIKECWSIARSGVFETLFLHHHCGVPGYWYLKEYFFQHCRVVKEIAFHGTQQAWSWRMVHPCKASTWGLCTGDLC